MRARAGERGQATVELVALVPLLVLIGLAIATFLAGHAVREAADQAAVAAAIAQLQGGDPEAAARAASPGWTRPRVTVAAGRIRVQIRPETLPGFMAARIQHDRTVAFGAAP